MVLIMGIADTGKTLLQEALTKFFYKIGLRLFLPRPCQLECRRLHESLGCSLVRCRPKASVPGQV